MFVLLFSVGYEKEGFALSNASVNSSCAHPPPSCGAFVRLVSPGGGAFANFALRGGRTFARPGANPEHLTRTLLVVMLQ